MDVNICATTDHQVRSAVANLVFGSTLTGKLVRMWMSVVQEHIGVNKDASIQIQVMHVPVILDIRSAQMDSPAQMSMNVQEVSANITAETLRVPTLATVAVGMSSLTTTAAEQSLLTTLFLGTIPITFALPYQRMDTQ